MPLPSPPTEIVPAASMVYIYISVLTRIFRPKGTNNICDPAPHLECSDSQYQTLVACVPLLTKDSKLSSMFTEFCSQSPDSSEVQVVQVAAKIGWF